MSTDRAVGPEGNQLFAGWANGVLGIAVPFDDVGSLTVAIHAVVVQFPTSGLQVAVGFADACHTTDLLKDRPLCQYYLAGIFKGGDLDS